MLSTLGPDESARRRADHLADRERRLVILLVGAPCDRDREDRSSDRSDRLACAHGALRSTHGARLSRRQRRGVGSQRKIAFIELVASRDKIARPREYRFAPCGLAEVAITEVVRLESGDEASVSIRRSVSPAGGLSRPTSCSNVATCRRKGGKGRSGSRR